MRKRRTVADAGGRTEGADAAITGGQCRAARGLLGMSQDELCRRARVTRKTLIAFERASHALRPWTAAAIVEALEQAGVAFLPAGDGMGPGVRLRADRKRQAKR